MLRVDFIKEYWDDVFTYFLDEYKRGRTPNPDIFAIKYIKFDRFLEWSKAQGCDLIATGHYAKTIVENGITRLLKPSDKNKDQTYFLSQLNQDQIKTTLFPLSDINKLGLDRLRKNLVFLLQQKKTALVFVL